MIKRIKPTHRMSQMTIHNNVVYSSGKTAKDTSEDIKGQTKQVLDSIDELLAEAGTSKSNLLSIQIWIANINDFAEMNEVYDAWVDKDNLGTRACVEAAAARPEILVEIRFIAAII